MLVWTPKLAWHANVAVRKICFVCSGREMHHLSMTNRHRIHNHEELCQCACACARVCAWVCSYLPQHQFSIHVHGEVTKVQQHLICSKLLLCDIIAVQHNDGYTQEQVEVVRLSENTENIQLQTLHQTLRENNQLKDRLHKLDQSRRPNEPIKKQ